ncbi:MAG: single-stranded DNA-binding protein [Rhodanobacter sp.]
MIDALLSGRLAADPKEGTASNGNRYATARLHVATGAEDRLSVSVIAFDSASVAGLLALKQGEAVTLAGELTPKVWTDKDGNARLSADMKAHALLTPYHVQRRRQAMAGEGNQAGT